MHFAPIFDADQFCRIAGLVGFTFYMASFAALQFKVIDGHGLTYSLLNVLAAFLVLISLAAEFNLASALIQVGWIIIGCAGIILRLRKRYQAPSGLSFPA
ncbi:MAG: hypothetical protein AAFQ64_07085 [Pseudomonadota bacterium]